MTNEYIVTYRNKWEKQTRQKMFETEQLALNWCHEQKHKRDFNLTRINNESSFWRVEPPRLQTITSSNSTTFHRVYSTNFNNGNNLVTDEGTTWHTR